MLENKEKKELINNISYIKEKNLMKSISSHNKKVRLFSIVGIFIGLALIIYTYFNSEISNIYSISVFNNNYLSDNDVIELSGLTNQDKYLLVSNKKIEKRVLESSSLIRECDVKKIDNNIISIDVKEKRIIGYIYDLGDYYLLLENNERYKLDETNVHLIKLVPLIVGFSADELILIEKRLSLLDLDIINNISEIHNYPSFKYQNLEIVMNDGNYIYSSVYGLNLLNGYYEMEIKFADEENHCIYFEDISSNAYTDACPIQ